MGGLKRRGGLATARASELVEVRVPVTGEDEDEQVGRRLDEEWERRRRKRRSPCCETTTW